MSDSPTSKLRDALIAGRASFPRELAAYNVAHMEAKRKAERRLVILATVSDMVMDLLYYDRDEDEELTTEDLEEAITSGDISVEELAGYFGAKLREEVFGS